MKSHFISLRRTARACGLSPFSGRYALLLPFVLVFLLGNALLRVGLAWQSGVALHPAMPLALLLGGVFDITVLSVALALLAVLIALWPQRWLPALRWVLAALSLPLCGVMAFVAFAEVTFWQEFSSRFNFIAVDYLIYTNEVLGNIRESYNLPLLLIGVAAVALLLWVVYAALSRLPWRNAQGARQTATRRWPLLVFWLALPVVLLSVVSAQWKSISNDGRINDIAGNGYFDFCHAFNTNEIDYNRYYRKLPQQHALRVLGQELLGDRPVLTLAQQPYVRWVAAPGQPLRRNVVLVSMESMSAEFMAHFGNTRQLTPNLDALASEGLLFTRLYATGTRTVRGLEALTLSVPPTPGHSIVKRPDNSKLFTLGEVFRAQGYEPLYLYGGYSYFDNMQAFFAGNGYTVIDRTAIPKQDVHFENIWGVADEDLFTLALREFNARHAQGKPFFAHIMTTSNHRPYTYPPGRIDIPSKTGREGGVKYADWAIGQFMAQARKAPWFANTVFVFVADHTHKGRGKTDLPPENYWIPGIFYAPDLIAPAQVDSIASQMDIAPTLLALLHWSYQSKFFGQNILQEGKTHQRALLANYQTVGYYEEGRIVELRPNATVRVVDARTGQVLPEQAPGVQHLVEEAIAYYQSAAEAYTQGALRKR